MSIRATCPECGSGRFKKNGHSHIGKQNHRCKVCGRQLDSTFGTLLVTKLGKYIGKINDHQKCKVTAKAIF